MLFIDAASSSFSCNILERTITGDIYLVQEVDIGFLLKQFLNKKT